MALLATEVIKIFDLMKDSKLERKKNINESYFRRKSLINKILVQENNNKKVKVPPTRGFSESNLPV